MGDASDLPIKVGELRPFELREFSRVEIVERDFAANRSAAFVANYPEIPDSCLFLQFFSFVDVPQVLADRPDIHGKEISDILLRKPKRLICIRDLHWHVSALGLVQHDFGRRLLFDVVTQWNALSFDSSHPKQSFPFNQINQTLSPLLMCCCREVKQGRGRVRASE
jgi:hypothetical protein